MRRDGNSCLGAAKELPLLLSGHRPLRLPDQLWGAILHVVLRDQHQMLHIHGNVSVQSQELLPEVAMLQQRLVLPGL
jgi:hypothetical protein